MKGDLLNMYVFFFIICVQTLFYNFLALSLKDLKEKKRVVTPCGYVARIICFHFCSCRYNCIVGSCLPLILVLNLVGPAKRFSDNKYIYPISSSFIAVSVYWRRACCTGRTFSP